MKRDFTSENLQKINQYIDEMKNESSVWDYVITYMQGIQGLIKKLIQGLVAAITTLFVKHNENPSNEALEYYYKHVVNKCEELKYRIKYIFERANEVDEEYAKKGEPLLGTGEEILKEIICLIEIATPEGISNIASSKAQRIDIPSVLDGESGISDEDLLAYCNGTVKVEYDSYIQAICEANSAVLAIDGADMFLTILLNFQDVGVDAIVSWLEGDGVVTKQWIAKQILNGTGGFLTPQEIADKVGCDVKIVEYYLQHGTIDELITGPVSNKNDLTNGRWVTPHELINAIDTVLAEQIGVVSCNESLLKKYCEDNDINYEYFKAIRDKDYNAYEKKCYYETIGKILEKACGSAEYKKNFDFKLSEAKKILSTIKDGKKIWDETTEEGKLLKKMWKNEILSDAEARKFLKSCCGYETVSDNDINMLRGITENANKIGGVKNIIGRGQQALDALAYLTADFTNETEMLDSIIESAKGNPSYEAALWELRTKYTDKLQGSINETVDVLEKEIINKGINAVLKKVPAVGIVETALDLAGKATGADKYTDAILDLPAYQGVANEMLKAYNDSVAAVAEGKGTLDNVRLNFTGLKQALTSYFEKNETYYKGMIDGAKGDAKRLAYSKYMLDRVKEMELGKSFEFLGFDEFINTYSI